MSRFVSSKQSCMEAIAPNSDWYMKVDNKYINLNYLRDEDIWNGKIFKAQLQDKSSEFDRNSIFLLETRERSLYEIIEEDPVQSFNFIQRESVKSPILIPRLALYLSGRALDLICERIFSKQGVNEDFAVLFYETFFTIFLKRPYTWSSLHLLVKASKAYPVYFKATIKMLLRDTHITSSVVQDYVERLNTKESTSLMRLVTEIQFTNDEFDHILPALFTIYKNSEKTERIFQFMQNNLEVNSLYCAYNKNYGRLLQYFVKNISGFDVRMRALKKMIDHHRTVYKSVCMAALEKHLSEQLAMQEDFFDGPRIIIPRPTDRFEI